MRIEELLEEKEIDKFRLDFFSQVNDDHSSSKMHLDFEKFMHSKGESFDQMNRRYSHIDNISAKDLQSLKKYAYNFYSEISQH